MPIQRWMNPDWLSNTWLLSDAGTREAIVVDTGADPGPVLEAIRAERLTVRFIVNTHHHHDHTGNNAAFAAALGAPVVAHELEAPLIEGPVRAVGDGEELVFGGLRGRVRHIPGHTRGHLALHVTGEADGVERVFTGDTLFRRSVGGTRAPGHATFTALRRSILETILALPADTLVHPGHTYPTTVREELEENPFVRAWRGLDPPGEELCTFAGRAARLLVWARDYDGGHKAWVRFEDGEEDVVPGSRVVREHGH